jgi:hypothetical protein
MEQELMASTRRKYTASFHTPFMTPPLVNELGYLATSKAAEEILEGTYRPPKGVDPYTKQLIHQLQRPVQLSCRAITLQPYHSLRIKTSGEKQKKELPASQDHPQGKFL